MGNMGGSLFEWPRNVLDWGQGAKADPEPRIRGPVVYLGGSPSKTQSRAET